jgi:tripartite-type tricarboxylate transporter receptor subunit TctC
MRHLRAIVWGFGAILLGVGTAGVAAEAGTPNYPTKPVEMIVAFPAGGGQDATFRLVAKYAEKHIGGRIVVLNKVGGGGVIGNTEIARSKPDGYTLGTISNNQVTDEFTVKGVPYSYKDFIPVAQIAADPHVLVAKNALKMDFKQYIEHARKNPNKVAMAMGGTWTSHDFFRLKLEKAYGVRYLRVAYQGGAPALQAVAGGHVDSAVPFVVEAMPSLEGKLVTPLAVSSPERVPTLPDVPSVRELGQDAVQANFRGISVPPGTPPEIIQRLEEAFAKTFKDPEFQNDLKKVGIAPLFRGQKDFAKYYKDEYDRYAALAKEFGIEPK